MSNNNGHRTISICSEDCVLNIVTALAECNDMMTPTIPTDDFYFITVNATADGGGVMQQYEVLNGMESLGTFDYGVDGMVAVLADGSPLVLTFIDIDNPNCMSTIDIGFLNPCSTDCELTITQADAVCNDNGTPSNNIDDFYTITVNADSLNGGDQFIVFNGTDSLGIFPYTTGGTLTLPANGDAVTLTFVDAENDACLDLVDIGILDPCSDDCILTILQTDIICNDNMTPLDTGDDFYVVSVNATSVNGSSNFIVNGLDTFAYNIGGTIILPADETVVTLTFVDELDATCFATTDIGPLDPCSNDCVLNITQSQANCNDNGTPTIGTDDMYTITINAEAQNGGSFYEVFNSATGMSFGQFGYSISGEITLIADGSIVTLEFVDLTNNNCTATVDVGPLDPCSGACAIDDAVVSNIICNDNNTPSDPTDDTFTFDVLASATNGTSWTATDGTTGAYDVIVNFGPFNIADGTQAITLADDNDATCTFDISVDPPMTCSGACVIDDAVVSNIICNDNGTNADPTDDTFTFDVLASATNGTSWTATDGTTGAYDVIVNFGPFNIADGTQAITLADDNDATCTFDISVDPPMTCSGACVIDDAVVSNIICNDNGTNADPTDDTFTFDVLASATNGTTWTATDGTTGAYDILVNFGPFNIADGTQAITIADDNDAACTFDISVDPPMTCSGACVLTLESVVQGLCDNQGTLNDATDDTFDATINISALNANGTYSATSSAGQSWPGPFNYDDLVILDGIPANGTDITLTITDALNPGCTIDVIVNQASCSDCTISADAGDDVTITCDSMGMAQVQGIGTAGANYTWTNIDGTDTIVTGSLGFTATTNGEYILIVSTSADCFAMDTMEVFIDDLVPLADAGPAQLITCDSSQVTLLGSSNIIDGATYEWSGPDPDFDTTLQNPTVDIPGTYSLIVTTGNCSSPAADVIVVDSTALPVAVILADPLVDTLDCVIESITLTPQGSSIGPNFIYQWNGGEFINVEQPSINVIDPGTYELTVINTISGCTNLETYNIGENEGFPPIVVQDPDPVTCVDPIISIDATQSFFSPDVVYQWTNQSGFPIDGETGLTLEVTSGGTYCLVAVDTTNGCTNDSCIVVLEDIILPAVNLGDDQILDCIDETAAIEGTTDILNAEYEWTPGNNVIAGGTTPNATVNSAGTFYLTVTNPETQCEATDSLVVAPPSLPVSSATVSPSECFGDNEGRIFIDTVIGGQAPYLYSIDGGENFFTFGSFNNLEAGSYDIVIQDFNGCEYTESATINEAEPIEIFVEPMVEIRLGESYNINAQINIPPGSIDSIMWTPADSLSCADCLDPVAYPTYSTPYEVTVVDTFGCEGMARIQIIIDEQLYAYIPTAFSPNGDGDNDFLIIYGDEGIEEIKSFEIFDRWGEKVHGAANFQPNDPQFGWDGRLKGEFMNPQVFVYYAEILLENGVIQIIQGDFTLLR